MGQNNSLMSKYGQCNKENLLQEETIIDMQKDNVAHFISEKKINEKEYCIRVLEKEDTCCISFNTPMYYYMCTNLYKNHVISYEYYIIYTCYNKKCPLCKQPISNILYKNNTK